MNKDKIISVVLGIVGYFIVLFLFYIFAFILLFSEPMYTIFEEGN